MVFYWDSSWIPLLLWDMKFHQFWICRFIPLHMLKQFIYEVDVGVGQFRVLVLGLGG